MKEFVNITENGSELEFAIKKGERLPDDAVNLGWYSTDEVTPGSYLSVADMSSFLPENSSNSAAVNQSFVMYADEFGVLRYAQNSGDIHQVKHSPIVKNSEVSISDYIIDQEDELDSNYSYRLDEFLEKRIAHSFYVSRYFTILPKTASNYNGIGRSLKIVNPDRYNIYVYDQFGNKYVDDFGKNKYEVFIERYPSTFESAPNDFYKIIVVMDDPDPVNFQLVYDKFEKSRNGIPTNQFLSYKEYINALPIYSYVVEESEVIDPSSFDRKVYSTQLFSHKENKLLKRSTEEEGWKVIVPRKAIQDPRTFQNFNWRLIAKINYKFSKVADIHNSSERAVLRVANLYSGLVENVHNPYIFANLEESVFNQQNFLFENPQRPVGSNKTQRAYWGLDISQIASLTSQQLFEYDLVVWTPNQAITEAQKRAIDLLLVNGVSVFLDCSLLDQSSISSSGLSNFDYSLKTVSKNSGYIKISEEYEEGDDEFNGWDLTSYQENDTSTMVSHNVFGPRINRLNDNSIIPLRVFDGTPESKDGSAKSVVSIQDGNNEYTAMLKDKYVSTSQFSPFIIISLNPILTYINDDYGINGLNTSAPNRGAVNSYPVGTPGNQKVSYSQSVIGPNKLFYNILTDSNRNRVNSRTQYNDSSTTVWSVSPWRNSWTINGVRNDQNRVTVLFDSEKKEFKFKEKAEEDSSTSGQNVQAKFCREIHESIGDLLISDFEATSAEPDSTSIIDQDFGNVEFYIECTNNNVKFLNFSLAEALPISGMNQPVEKTPVDINTQGTGGNKVALHHNFFVMSANAKKKVAASKLTIDAYTDIVSREFDLGSLYYPHIILDYADTTDYRSINPSVIRRPVDILPGSQFVKDYDFDFFTQIYVNQTETIDYTYDVEWYTAWSTGLEAIVGNITYMSQKGNQPTKDGQAYVIVAQEDEQNGIVVSSVSPFKGYKYPTNVYSVTDITTGIVGNRNTANNSFHYTDDIPTSKYTGTYS